MHRYVILLLLLAAILPLVQNSVPGLFFWKPRITLHVGRPPAEVAAALRGYDINNRYTNYYYAEPPEDLAIEPNDDVKYFNEFDVIIYTCKAKKTTSKYTPYLFWYHSMNTKLSVPILSARNDLGVGNVDFATLKLNLTLQKDANMSKVFCLQRYFDWDITKYHNVAKSKSITLVLKKNYINDKGFKEDNLLSQKNVPGTRKEPTESGQSSTPLIIGCVLASLIILVLVIIIIVLCRRNRVVIVQESEVEHVYEEINSHLIEKSTVRYAKIDVPRNQSAQKDIQPSCQYAVIVGKLVPKDTDRYQHPALA